MKPLINLVAGTPNDANRDYLPEEIKGSDMVVNENGNNSQVYPERLIEYKDCLVDEQTDTWYEYVPASYDPDKKTPLVFSMHGGLMTGWGQCIYTSWSHVADREGFIVVFPDALLRRFWMIECPREKYEELSTPVPSGVYMNPFPEDINENHDVRTVLALIGRMKEKYNIDEKRIYMQGMSLGNSMTAMIARHFGNLFAGAAGSAGTSAEALLFDENGNTINKGGPLAVWQTRVEIDNVPPGSDLCYEDAVVVNRNYWLKINECETIPELCLTGENNFAFYKGKKADYVFRDVKNRDHGQTFDDAELVWDYLFSGTARNEKGGISRLESVNPRKGDSVSFAMAPGSSYAWVNNKKVQMPVKSFLWQKLKYHGLEGSQIVRGEYNMVPVTFLAEAFGAEYVVSEEGGKVTVTMPDGPVLQFVRGCIGCVVDNKIHSMLCEAVGRNNILYIPAEWFCAEVCQMHVSVCKNVMYATDHYSVLSGNMARLIKDLLQ